MAKIPITDTVTRNISYAELNFQKRFTHVICRPGVYFHNTFWFSMAAEYYAGNCSLYAAKIFVIFYRCFKLIRCFYQFLLLYHTFFICKKTGSMSSFVMQTVMCLRVCKTKQFLLSGTIRTA